MSLCRGYKKWYYNDNKNRDGFLRVFHLEFVYGLQKNVYSCCEECHPKLPIIMSFPNANWPDNVPRDDVVLLSA